MANPTIADRHDSLWDDARVLSLSRAGIVAFFAPFIATIFFMGTAAASDQLWSKSFTCRFMSGNYSFAIDDLPFACCSAMNLLPDVEVDRPSDCCNLSPICRTCEKNVDPNVSRKVLDCCSQPPSACFNSFSISGLHGNVRSEQSNGEDNTALENVSESLTCEQRRYLGPDATWWDTTELMWVHIWPAYQIMLPANGALASLFYFIGMLSVLDWCVNFRCGVVSGFREFVFAKRRATKACFAIVLCSLGCLILPILIMVFVCLASIMFYPIFVEFKWYHIERSIFFCIPGLDVAISASVFFAYTIKSIWSIMCARHGWEDPEDKYFVFFSAYQCWVCLLLMDIYTGFAAFLCFRRAWPVFLQSAWLGSMLISCGLMFFGIIKVKRFHEHLLYMLVVQLLLKEVPQIMIMVWGISFCGASSGIDQYVLYCFTGNVVALASLANKICHSQRLRSLVDAQDDNDEESLLQLESENNCARRCSLYPRGSYDDSRTLSRIK